MKPIITGFFDLEGKATFDEQIATAERHHLHTICLRTYNRRPIIELSDNELKQIVNITKSEKFKIAILDTQITPYDINDDRKHAEAVDQFKYMIKVAERLKVNHLYYRLPLFNDVIEEYEHIEKRLNPIVEAASKSNKKIILYPNNNYKSNIYAYIFKKMKTNILSIAFDPVYMMNNDESTTTGYRLLKKKIGAFLAIDADHQNVPKLLGYGKTDILNIFKKLLRDRYTGFMLVDNKFHGQVFEMETQKVGLIAKIFKTKEKKKKTLLDELSAKIFPNEETKNVTHDDILDNQINVLKMIFK